GLKPSGNTALFQWVRTRAASTIQDALARRGIWVRLFDDPASVRFGLPGSEGAWQRLEKALAAVAETQTDAVSP
ncbi:MAG: threonine-phosphate decarboxylase, partial [Gammaproteobacteria bacterium]